MDHLKVNVKLKLMCSVALFVFLFHTVTALDNYSLVYNEVPSRHWEIRTLDHVRARRAVGLPPAKPSPEIPPEAIPTKATETNKTTNPSEVTTPLPTASVTLIPPLGQNGSGILNVDWPENMPKVSDPIMPDDNGDGIFKAFNETPERIKSEQNITNLTYDNHNFYNSSFIGNVSYFNEYWANISKHDAQVHAVLSNSHRRATTLQLSFPFPFYGNNVTNITVATGGFIYTGEHVHNWLAATQYIAPLMANFDTSLTNESVVKLYDDGEKFTAFWENVTLQEDVNKTFTFAVTLYKNGDIVFAYKNIPIDVQAINDTEHPVKVGISDAYLTDNIMFYVRKKTIYEYHRVTFKNHEIASNTILKLTALPTCLQYTTCDSCLNHNTGFNCTWCPQIQKCSSGTDRNKQDWKLRNCERNIITNASSCGVPSKDDGTNTGNATVYTTDTQSPAYHNTSIDTLPDPTPKVVTMANSTRALPSAVEPPRSTVGGAVAAFIAVGLVVCLAAWILYAFKNPHTRSGQMLIKYRPSQWSWKRGEARYTAATIHM